MEDSNKEKHKRSKIDMLESRLPIICFERYKSHIYYLNGFTLTPPMEECKDVFGVARIKHSR
eukprot:2463274-Amphidinium_carterae.2